MLHMAHKILLLLQWFSTGVDSGLQRTSTNIWRHVGCHTWEEGAVLPASSRWRKGCCYISSSAQTANVSPTTANVNSAKVKKPSSTNRALTVPLPCWWVTLMSPCSLKWRAWDCGIPGGGIPLAESFDLGEGSLQKPNIVTFIRAPARIILGDSPNLGAGIRQWGFRDSTLSNNHYKLLFDSWAYWNHHPLSWLFCQIWKHLENEKRCF